MRTLRLKQPEQCQGFISILAEEITRETAGRRLEPPVSARTIQTYLDTARLYLQEFSGFTDDVNGGLNRSQKLTVDRLPTLQKIRDYVRSHGMIQLQIQLANNPQYFSENENQRVR